MKKKYSLFLTEKIGYPDKADTNLLIKESILRGYQTYAFRPSELVLHNIPQIKLIARAHKVSLDKKGNLRESEEFTEISIDTTCIVTIRLNPPFDSRYYSAMHMLAYKENEAFITNRPSSIASMPEKLVSPELLKFMPKTIITDDLREIEKFWRSEKDIIIKPLSEFAGRSVFRLMEREENYKSIFQVLADKYHEPLVAQKYIPEVKKGDKRIVLIDGEYTCCFNRVPPEGQLQAATARGGSFVKTELTAKEKEMCKILKPILKEAGILYCGFDVIGDYLTEVNVTCPAGLISMSLLDDKNGEKIYWDILEKKLG